MIPFFDAHSIHDSLRTDFEDAFKSALNRSNFILGEEVALFEKEFAAFCGVTSCVSVGNGLDALVLALRAWGIGPGDEVIVPGQTFVATWLAVSAVGAEPIPVDVDPRTALIDIDKVPAAITSKTKAVIPVHLYGQAVDIVRLRAGIPGHVKILEDAAQAHGAILKGQRVGSLGDAAAFSFYPTKNLGCLGDGGAVTTSDSALARDIAKIRNYGSKVKYVHEVEGVNSRLDEMQAAFLRIKLPYLDGWNESRINAANRYSNNLKDIAGLELPNDVESRSHVFHLYVVKTSERDALQRFLADSEITALIHYPIAPGKQPLYSGREHRLVDSDRLAAESLSLPIWPNMPSWTIDEVSTVVRSFFSR